MDSRSEEILPMNMIHAIHHTQVHILLLSACKILDAVVCVVRRKIECLIPVKPSTNLRVFLPYPFRAEMPAFVLENLWMSNLNACV